MEYTRAEFNKMNTQLKKMGINFENIGKPQTASLPPLPSSDEASLARNTYSSFYKVGAREFWQHSELGRNEVPDFKKCEKHFFLKRGEDKVMCRLCHIGWVVGPTYSIRNGDLYDGETPLHIT